MVEANRAVAVAMAEGPAAGLVILDVIGKDPGLARWPQLQIARAELLRQLGRGGEAATAYEAALALGLAGEARELITGRLRSLTEAGQ